MEIRTLKIYSKNINDQENFYRNIIGFKCRRESESRLSISTKENTLILEKSRNEFYYHFAFLIPTGAIQKAIIFLEMRNIKLLLLKGNKIIDFRSGKAIYFYDTDGNIVEFIERPSLNYPHKHSFCIDDIIKLNEIGLPSPKPQRMAIRLISQYKIIPINQDEFTDHFCWVGDYNGVIIVVKEGRSWLPTDKPGILNDFSLHYTEEGKDYRLIFANNEIKNSRYL